MLGRWVWRRLRPRAFGHLTVNNFSPWTRTRIQRSRRFHQPDTLTTGSEQKDNKEMPEQVVRCTPPELDALKKVLGLVSTAEDHPARTIPDDVAFVCIDCEAFEHDQSQITEIGISVFDTRDVAHISPGKEWLDKIQCAHFRPVEYALLRNKQYAVGCPDGFRFGKSTWVHLSDLRKLLERLLLDPAKLREIAHFSTPVVDQGRKILLLGHSLKSDVKFLQAVGVDLRDQTAIIRTFDAQNLCGASKKSQPSLKKILHSLDIETTGLHNAGNDAAYTLMAAITMALKEYDEGVGSVVAGLAQHNGSMPETPPAVSTRGRLWGGSARPAGITRLSKSQKSEVRHILGRGGVSRGKAVQRLKDGYDLVREVGIVALQLRAKADRRRGERIAFHRSKHFSNHAERSQERPSGARLPQREPRPAEEQR